MSNYNNYEQILCEWLSQFVDTNADGNPLVFRNTAPTLEEVESFGNADRGGFGTTGTK